MSSDRKWPASFYCALSNTLMKDPVTDPEGNTYDREAITAWLQKFPISPINRGTPLHLSELVPNRALKETIDAMVSAQGGMNTTTSRNKRDSKQYEEKSDLEVEIISKNSNCLVSVKPPNSFTGVTRSPTTICCVIDVSGSMNTEAKIINDEGFKEGYGLSTLDLVKHSVRTIIATLGEEDYLSLVSFSTKAETTLELTRMDEAGKKKAEKAINAMRPQSLTNLWDGLYHGLETLRAASVGKNSAVFLLTDGQPNVIPPRGHLEALQKYKDEHGLPNVINTFGYGYDLDSELLQELAREANGAYAFIPDGSIVGTVFVNALANLLSTVATDVRLSIELNQSQIVDQALLKHYNHQITSWGVELQLGSIMFGQPKQFVLPLAFYDSRRVSATLKYNTPFKNLPVRVTREIDIQEKDDLEIDMQKFRLTFVNVIMEALKLRSVDSVKSIASIENLITQMKASRVANQKYIQDLLADLEGQITLAISRTDYFTKWGRHFLPSLTRAHLMQQCNNFKDPGVQNYGGQIFHQLRDKVEGIFVQIPPPEPSVKTPGSHVHVTNMAVFHNLQGGCIDGDCLVTMADGTTKYVKNIVKGDEVVGFGGKSAKVVCVVKKACENNRAKLVQLASGLRITPWHPIRLNGKFVFPCTVQEPFFYQEYDCPAVYTFVLDNHHSMVINGVECVTLAHGFQDDVTKHDYFGTSAVLKDLQKIQGWEDGFVEIGFDKQKKYVPAQSLGFPYLNQALPNFGFSWFKTSFERQMNPGVAGLKVWQAQKIWGLGAEVVSGAKFVKYLTQIGKFLTKRG